MITPKKRTLNEIRQTKDNFYVVPELKKIDDSQQLFKDFFIETNNINSNNYLEFVSFIRERGYQIVKKSFKSRLLTHHKMVNYIINNKFFLIPLSISFNIFLKI